MGWPSIPVLTNLHEGYCIAMKLGGITTPYRPLTDAADDILQNGFIVIPFMMNANINGKLYHPNQHGNIFRLIYLLLTLQERRSDSLYVKSSLSGSAFRKNHQAFTCSSARYDDRTSGLLSTNLNPFWRPILRYSAKTSGEKYSLTGIWVAVGARY